MDKGVSIKIDGVSAPISVESGYIAVRESVDFFVPSGTIQFKDRMSNFVSSYPIMQDTVVDVSFDDGSSFLKHRFAAFSSKKVQSIEGVESFDVSLDLISKLSNPLLIDREYHSKRCTGSDYIKYIADRCGLKSEIEATGDVRSWINPNWTFAQMVRYIAQRSVSVAGSGGFLYFVRLDGTLVFKSIDRLFDETRGIDVTAGSYVFGEDDEEETNSNRSMVIKDNHFANVILGSNNVKLKYFDYKQGKDIESTVDHEKYLRKRGSVRGVASSLSNTGKSIHIGVSYTEDVEPSALLLPIYNKVLRQFESTQLQMVAPMNKDYKLGGVINLSIPANDSVITGGVNMNYSGRYLIKSIMTLGHGDYKQKLVLARPGISLPTTRKIGYF